MFARVSILCAALLFSTGAFARPGTAVSTVNLRAEANTTSEILAKIPGGARLDVGGCNAGWCAVTFAGKSGFAIATALDTTGRRRPIVRRGPPLAYDDDDDEYIPVRPPYPAYPRGYIAPGPYYYGPGPYWGGYWGPGWGWRGGWRRW
jgi:hypothetical protein